MAKHCFIVEDLLPLYNEMLLSEETTEWLEAHTRNCPKCKKILLESAKPFVEADIEPSVIDKNMFTKINRKLSTYQMIFVSLSLILAMTTSMLNESFHFILTYTILGMVTYVFYKDVRIVFLVAFIPIFLWYIGTVTRDYVNGDMIEGLGIGKFIVTTLFGGAATAFIHFIFALIGTVIGFFILKIVRGDEK